MFRLTSGGTVYDTQRGMRRSLLYALRKSDWWSRQKVAPGWTT